MALVRAPCLGLGTAVQQWSTATAPRRGAPRRTLADARSDARYSKSLLGSIRARRWHAEGHGCEPRAEAGRCARCASKASRVSGADAGPSMFAAGLQHRGLNAGDMRKADLIRCRIEPCLGQGSGAARRCARTCTRQACGPEGPTRRSAPGRLLLAPSFQATHALQQTSAFPETSGHQFS
jgi:hypothetical protein